MRHRRWGVILAGGDGTRLRGLTKLICGDDRPKQFCPLFGGQSLVEQTRQRAERNIPPEQVLFALTRAHREHYVRELASRRSQCIVQPENRGTAPPILHSILSIARLDANALVSILPSDHHYSNEKAFSAALDSSFDLAAKYPDSVVTLGAQADRPETEYEWLELGPPAKHPNVFRVQDFQEKPSIELAQGLLDRGSVWNTFVMAGQVRAFVEMILSALPGLLGAFQKTRLWAGAETHVEDSLYERMTPVDFSRQVLAVETARLLALRTAHLGWSDLGHPERVIAVHRDSGTEPWWAKEWEGLRRRPETAPALVKPAVA